MVLDRGPQVISHVQKAFAKAIGATVSLSPGFHSQTNGPIQPPGKLNKPFKTLLVV